MRCFIIPCLLFLCWLPQCYAQFNDDFSTQNLSFWEGDTASFTINDQAQLQLMAEEAGSSFLYTQVQVPDSAVWQLDVFLEFSPSSSNAFQWILQSGSVDLRKLSGYGLSLGESGSDDALEFIRWDEGKPTILGRMKEGSAAMDPVQLRIRIEREGAHFRLLAAYDGSDNYSDTLEVSDAAYAPGPLLFSGLICKYTATRKDKFIFDNYLIERSKPDRSPPVVDSVKVMQDRLLVYFNERIDISEARYELKPGNFIIRDSLIYGEAGILLQCDTSFTSLQAYTLVLKGIKDGSGNTKAEWKVDFTFISSRAARPFELVINEIMAAPNDKTPLPAAEYIEIYNRTDDYLQLGGLFLLDPSGINALPKYKLAPGDHLILCDTDDTTALSAYGKVLGIDNFISLNNGGDHIAIKDGQGTFIHGVNYTDQWYGDDQKDDGGWSLELIRPDLACSQSIAYAASLHVSGGTPGKHNSHSMPELQDSLMILRASPSSPYSVELKFNQWLPADNTWDQSHIEITPESGIEALNVSMESPDLLELHLSDALEKGVLYNVRIRAEFKDCLLSPIERELQIQIGLPAIPDSGDLLISEILFDPHSGQSQWVEIHNPGTSIYDFRYLVLKARDEEGSSQTSIGLDHQIMEGQYFVLSESHEDIMSYHPPFPNRILSLDLPSLDRRSGTLELWYIFGAEAQLIDRVCYDEQWHSGFLREEKGVSLERLSFQSDACTSNNWQSASEDHAFGTPTGANSQRIGAGDGIKTQFTLQTPVFSPDGDGFQDFMLIEYRQPEKAQAGSQLSLNIYTPDGYLINPLFSNYALGSYSQLIWDGRMHNGIMANEGFYILQLETFDENGDIDRWQATVYLTYPEK